MALSLWGCLWGGAALGVVPGDLIAKRSAGKTRSKHGVVSSQRCLGDRASPSQQVCNDTPREAHSDPWGPAFLLGISHIGVEHLQTDLNYSISSPFKKSNDGKAGFKAAPHKSHY